MNISKDLDVNIKYFEDTFKDCGDIVKYKFPVGVNKDIWCYIVYVDGMIDRNLIDDSVMNVLIHQIREVPPTTDEIKNNIFDALKFGGITTADLNETEDIIKATDEILVGNTLLLIDGVSKALIISSKGYPRRSVSEADTEVVVQGSKEAFTEAFRTNTALVRRRIKDTRLKIKQSTVGRRTKTYIAMVYMDDVVRPEILKEAEDRIANIDIDGIIDSGYIEQLIEDDWLSPFPQIQMTERPDKVAAEVLEGRIAVIVDNSPFALIIPAVFPSFYQASEDYYERWQIMSFVRVIRYIAGFLAVSLPGLYIAMSVFHPSMIPMFLIFKMADARQSVPIPAVVEVLIMELAFETLREAGIRLPSSIGSTLGIVGGIIIGQAAVDAGIVSPIVVIIISLTGICSFAIPNISLVAGFRIMKYLIIIMSALFGLFGFWLAAILILIHLVSLKSFGIPYLFPFTSSELNNISDFKDTIFRAPLFMMKKRPIFANPNQKIRLSNDKTGNKRKKE